MNYEQFFNKLRTNFERGLEVMKRKNHDYADEVDPYKNFRAAEMFGLTVEQGILLRISDKMARIANAISGKEMKVTDETVENDCGDLMNYANILMTYLQNKEQSSPKQMACAPDCILKHSYMGGWRMEPCSTEESPLIECGNDKCGYRGRPHGHIKVDPSVVGLDVKKNSLECPQHACNKADCDDMKHY